MAQADSGDYASLYKRSIDDREGFWAEQAQALDWFAPWKQVLDDSKRPFFRWFVGAKTNIAHNAVDRHVKTWRRNKVAILWEGEDGEVRSYTYQDVYDSVNRMAHLLKGMGVQKGEVVTIYMSQVPELAFGMLACAKIGAMHSVVYGGYSIEALATRIDDARSTVLLTADGGFRRGKITDLKAIANEAMKRCPTIRASITVKRTGQPVHMEPGRDFWLHELLEKAPALKHLDAEVMDAEDPLFILYTSGTTGKPKALLHTHGGYSVYVATTHRIAFGIRDEDRYWCTADPGWITGHSYLVYGPLINGTTVFMYEGAPNYPQPDRWWGMIERHGINVLYTSPTAIRGLMRSGDEWPDKHDLSSLRMLGSVGEPINPEAWRWYHEKIGHGKCPIIDTWWQTETGGFMITPLPETALKPGSATKPFYGNEVAVVDEQGKPVATGQEGLLVIKNPWPGMARTIFKDPERYKETYWKTYEKQGWFKTGDAARIDEDGYVWVIGRVDEVIKVSGYRLGTAEIESALITHPAVAEAAAIGLPHDIKGNAIHVYVVLRVGKTGSPALAEELREHVAKEIGPIAKPETVEFVDALPKTRSGKIMRRVLKARALGQDPGDISTLEE